MSDNAPIQFSDGEALLFHSEGRPGKIEIVAARPLAGWRSRSADREHRRAQAV